MVYNNLMETNKNSSYTTSLVQAGLSYGQARVYEILLKNGPLKAGKIHQKSDLKRGLVYKALDELVEMGLATKQDSPGKVSIFTAEHPGKVKLIAEQREEKAKTAQLILDGILGQMTSDFNLISGAPSIRFYEGLEGAKKVANDSLGATTEILSYIDNEAVNKYLADFNKSYIAKRNKLAIKKRMIAVDSEYVQRRAKELNKSTTEIRTIPSPSPFSTVMQIYDQKVSYITLDEKKIIGIIVDDPLIAQMHTTLFNALWNAAQPLSSTMPQLPNSSAALPH